MKFTVLIAFTLTSFFALAAQALEVGPCYGLDRVSFLVGQTKSYSQGKIRIAEVDTDGEPVCCSSHLLVIIPLEPLGSQCFAVSQKAGSEESSALGFNSIDFRGVRASYDPAKGLLLNLPFTLYNDGRTGSPGRAKVRVDLRASGTVRIER